MNFYESRVPAGKKIAIAVWAIVGFLLFAAFLLSMPVLYQWSLWVLVGVFSLSCAGALLWALLVDKLLRRGKPSRSFRVFVVLFALLTVLVALPIYYLIYKVEADPPLVPTVVLSDGDKTVVFQGMIHVGMESFYKSVVYDLEAALTEGYRLYYEGVQPSRGEGDAWFSEHLAGGGDLAENYQKLAEACGVKFQVDYFELLAADARTHPDQHVAADVSALDMKQEYDRLMASDPDFARAIREAEQGQEGDENTDDGFVELVLGSYAKADKEQKALIGVLCRGAFAFVLGGEQRQEKVLDRVVLDFRNRKLVERILADDSDKIYITYGAAHLPGVVSLLNEADSRWHVKSVKWSRGMGAPEHLEGNLMVPDKVLTDLHNKEE